MSYIEKLTATGKPYRYALTYDGHVSLERIGTTARPDATDADIERTVAVRVASGARREDVEAALAAHVADVESGYEDTHGLHTHGPFHTAMARVR